MNRILVTGDIHGGLKALVQLLERARVKPQDTLVFLGDYVDGWSDSARVVSYLIALSQQNTCIFLRGNHDDLTYRWLKHGELNDQWLQHGGQSTINAYRKLPDSEREKHIRFFNDTLNYYIDKEDRLFVHAGFTNLKGPEEEYNPIVFYWDRTLWEMAKGMDPSLEPGDLLYPERFSLFREIYVGHTPVTRIGHSNPVKKANVFNMDTGAGFRGELSMMDVHTKEIFQSDPVWTLYPEETGRN